MYNEGSTGLVDTLGDDVCGALFRDRILPYLSYEERINWRRVCRLFNAIYISFMQSEKPLSLHKEITFHAFLAEHIIPEGYRQVNGGLQAITDALTMKPTFFMERLKTFFGITAGEEMAADIELIFDVLTQVLNIRPLPIQLRQIFPAFNRQSPGLTNRPVPLFNALAATLLQRMNPVQMQQFITFLKQLLARKTIETLEKMLKNFEEEVKRYCPAALVRLTTTPRVAREPNAIPALAPNLVAEEQVAREAERVVNCSHQVCSRMMGMPLAVFLLVAALLIYGSANLIFGSHSNVNVEKGLPAFIVGLIVVLGYILYNIGASCDGWMRYRQLAATMRLLSLDPEREPLLPV